MEKKMGTTALGYIGITVYILYTHIYRASVGDMGQASYLRIQDHPYMLRTLAQGPLTINTFV